MDTPLLQNILFPLLALGSAAGITVANTHIRCIDGVLGWYDNNVGDQASISEFQRNTIREALTVDLAGAAQAASPCCLAWEGGEGGMPGYSEENSWCVFTTADNGEDGSANLTAGGFTALPTHYSWLLQHWDHAWKAAITTGVLPSGSAYIVRSLDDGTAVAPTFYVEGYGFDTVDDVASIAIAATFLIAALSPTLINITPYQP